MPATSVSVSPARPLSIARMTGTPPATAPSNRNWQPCAAATAQSAGPACAMTCLFAVTTGMPRSSAARIQRSAGSSPPMSSTKTSAPPSRASSTDSVHRTRSSGHPFALIDARRSTTATSWTSSGNCWRTVATDRPTVPKPARTTRQGAAWEGDGLRGSRPGNTAPLMMPPLRARWARLPRRTSRATARRDGGRRDRPRPPRTPMIRPAAP